MKRSISRADLLEILAAFPDAQATRLAAQLGFSMDVEAPAAPVLASSVLPEPSTEVASHSAPTAVGSMTYWRIEAAEGSAVSTPKITQLKRGNALTISDLNHTPGSYFAAPSTPPLTRWERLWPVLQRMLLGHRESREPDLQRVMFYWSRGEPARRIPKRRRRTWTSSVNVWLDRSHRMIPFWHDQMDLCRRLRRVCGSSGFSIRVLREAMQSAAMEHRGNMISRSHIVAGSTVLVLGDLGAYATKAVQEAWDRTGRRIGQLGARPVALLPAPRVRWPGRVLDAWNAEAWEISHEKRRDGEARDPAYWSGRAEALLSLCSMAGFVQPGLLRALRRLLPSSEVDGSTEVDVWQHSDVHAPDSAGFVLRPRAREVWRRRFASLADRGIQRRVSGEISKWHAQMPRELLFAETLSWIARIRQDVAPPPGSVSEATSFALKLGSTLRGGHCGKDIFAALSAYGRSFLLSGVPPEIYGEVPELGLLWAAASMGIRTEIPDGLNAEQLDAEIGVSGEPRAWAVRQIGDVLRVRARASLRWPSDMDEPGSPLASIVASGPHLSVKHNLANARRCVLEDGVEIAIPSSGRIEIRSDHGALVVAPWEPESWMSASGRDPYGLWCAFEVAGVTVRMRWIPPGRFVMGSPETEAGRLDSEGPQHEVTLTEGYWLGETPVTQALWKTVMGENPSRFVSHDRPVEHVSWLDCEGFIARVNTTVTGLDARFPTESEWEYACRGGTTTARWAGDFEIIGADNAPALDPWAWYGGNCGIDFELKNGADRTRWPDKQYDHPHGGSHPVARKRPNPLGLYDMLGNVYEWCEDWYESYESGSVVDPRGPNTGTYRVFRGGSWLSFAQYVRAAHRSWSRPEDRDDDVGFRLARGQGLRSGGGAGVARSDTPRRGADAPRSAPVRDAPAPEIQGPPRRRKKSR